MSLIPSATKVNSARLGQKWYVVGNDGRPMREMRASMIRRVQRQHKVHMNSLQIPILSEGSKNVKIEKFTQGSKRQPS